MMTEDKGRALAERSDEEMTETLAEENESAWKRIFAADDKKITAIASIKDGKERREQLHRMIGEIINGNAKESLKEENVDLIMKRLEFLHSAFPAKEDEFEGIEGAGGINEIDRAWSLDQVDAFLDSFSDDNPEKMDKGYFFSVLVTSQKKKGEQNTISDLLTKALTKRIEDGETLPYSLQSELNIWFQQIHMVDEQLRLDFLIAILNNPGY